MPVQISEHYDSREFTVGSDAGWELLYSVLGTDDDIEVRDLLLATSPTSYQGLIRDSVGATPEGGGFWRGTVRYKGLSWGESEEEEVTLSDFAFDTTGGTEKITQSYETTAYSATSTPAPLFKGAIGVNGDVIEGAPIPVPKYEFTETHHFDDSFVTLAYRMILFQLTGRTNQAPFKGFDTGEVLFMGASGSKRGTEKWQISYKFACSPNVVGMTVGGIPDIEKGGWQWLWCLYQDKEDADAFTIVKEPVAVYVEEVLLSGDLSLLGIGV